MSDETPRIWIGCLGCYNAGRLVGEWFDAIDAPTDMTTFFGPSSFPRDHMLEAHEELWVFDHEGFRGWLTGECSPADAVALAELIVAIEADHQEPEAVKAWADHTGNDVTEWDKPTREAFEDAYNGEWSSEQDFAENLADDLGLIDSDASWPNNYIDWERATRELFITDYYSVEIPSGGVYVFRNY